MRTTAGPGGYSQKHLEGVCGLLPKTPSLFKTKISVRFSLRPDLLLRRGTPEGRILGVYYGFNANISFTFQAIKNLFAYHDHISSFLAFL